MLKICSTYLTLLNVCYWVFSLKMFKLEIEKVSNAHSFYPSEENIHSPHLVTPVNHFIVHYKIDLAEISPNRRRKGWNEENTNVDSGHNIFLRASHKTI